MISATQTNLADISKPKQKQKQFEGCWFFFVTSVNWPFKSPPVRHLQTPEHSHLSIQTLLHRLLWRANLFSCCCFFFNSVFPKSETSRSSAVTAEVLFQYGCVLIGSCYRGPGSIQRVVSSSDGFYRGVVTNEWVRVLCWAVSGSIQLPANGPDSLFWVEVKQPCRWFWMFSPIKYKSSDTKF